MLTVTFVVVNLLLSSNAELIMFAITVLFRSSKNMFILMSTGLVVLLIDRCIAS